MLNGCTLCCTVGEQTPFLCDLAVVILKFSNTYGERGKLKFPQSVPTRSEKSISFVMLASRSDKVPFQMEQKTSAQMKYVSCFNWGWFESG